MLVRSPVFGSVSHTLVEIHDDNWIEPGNEPARFTTIAAVKKSLARGRGLARLCN
jgi:hypothetical protein